METQQQDLRAIAPGTELIVRLSRFNYTRAVLARKTPTQGVLMDGRKFQLDDGRVIGYSGIVYAPTAELIARVEQEEADKARDVALLRAKARIRDAVDIMRESYFSGFTAEELDAVAVAIEGAIASREQRRSP